MAKHDYNIAYLPSFDKEFEEILYYILYKLKNRKAAEELIQNVEQQIQIRSISPEGFEKYVSKKKRQYDWYRIYVGNFTVFYSIQNDTMIVAHILYSKRNIEEFL